MTRQRRSGAGWRPALAAKVSLAAGALLLAVAAWSQDAVLALDIPAQSLDQALLTLARQSGARILFATEATERHQAAALRERLTVRDALQRLLAGTGLQALATPDGGFTVTRPAAPRPGAAAPAASPAPVPTLGTVTVLGTREPDVPLANVAASISVIPRATIQEGLAVAGRIEDVIANNAPGFNPTNNGVRQIRGRTAQVFVNGVPLNEQLRASAAADLNLLSPEQIDGIEVARGANSAHGFGSPGGIVALTTPRAQSEQLALRSKASLSVNPGQAGASQQLGLYQSAARIAGDFDWHVGVAVRKDGLAYDPDGRLALQFDSPVLQSNSKERLLDVDANLGWNLHGAGELRLAVAAGRADVTQAYDSDFAGVYRQQQAALVRAPAGDANDRRYYALNLSYDKLVLGETVFTFELLASRVHTRAFDAYGAPVNLDDQRNSYRGLRSSATTALDQLQSGATLTWGLDALRNRYFRPYQDAATGTVLRYFAPDVTLDTVAPYLQAQAPFGNWRLAGGVRHERYRGHVEDASANGGPVGGAIRPFQLTLWNAGVVYSPRAGREWYGSFTQGAEISQLGRDARGAGAAVNLDPRPAKSNQFELGLRERGNRHEWGLAAFYTESDLLSALQCDGLTPCVPLREPREFWGVEASARWRATAATTLGASLAWMEGQRTLPSGEQRRIGSRDVPPLLLTAYLEHAFAAGWKARLQADHHGSRDPFGGSTAFGEGRVDSLTLAHVSASVPLGPGQLRIGVRNLFDRKYFALPVQADNTGFYWIPEQGRRLAVSYAVDW